MVDRVTCWTKSGYDANDPYAAEAWSTPQVIACEYMIGGRMQRDVEGVEFQPAASIYSVIQIPFGARVLFGTSTDLTPPATAEIIRKTGTGTKLAHQTTEYEAFTG
jgi:hypothetical protein